MTTPHTIPSKPAPQPDEAMPAFEPVEWMDTVPMTYRDESEIGDA